MLHLSAGNVNSVYHLSHLVDTAILSDQKENILSSTVTSQCRSSTVKGTPLLLET